LAAPTRGPSFSVPGSRPSIPSLLYPPASLQPLAEALQQP
jgi:hypothetical protein